MEDEKSFLNFLEKDPNPPGLFSLSRRTASLTTKENLRVGRSSIIPTYSQFEEINKLFNSYVPQSSNPKLFVNQLYKMELTGAKIKINNKSFIIVEERKNSIITISQDNRIRTFIKSGLEFIFEHNNVQYLILGKGLKLNRFVKK